MAVAHKKERSRMEHREHHSRAGTAVARVHVAPVIAGPDAWDWITRRRHTDAPEIGPRCDLDATKPFDVALVGCEHVHRKVGPGQDPEAGYDPLSALAPELDVEDVNGQGIAWLGTIN